jgi:hypothetical protein
MNYDTAATYGVRETNGLTGPIDYDTFAPDPIWVSDLAARGGRFTRIRLLTERGYPRMDVSYIHAEVKGVAYHVAIDFDTHSLNRRTYRTDLQTALMRDCGLTKAQVAKLGVWNDGTYSILWG